MKKGIATLILLAGFLISFAQNGCTDPQAVNYETSAVHNDGSCLYPITNYQLTPVAELPDILMESSALSYFAHQLWSLNDADNPADIYEIDTTNGLIIRQVNIAGTENTDWEEMAEDEDYLYIGDFGNNPGNRQDLRIYKIARAELAMFDTITAELITFSFSDQTDFSEAINSHNFDCEAMLVYNDSLHLFSKNWLDYKTRHYILSTTAGSHIARLRDSMDVNGLITGATINEEGTVLLLGYTGLTNFMWLLFDFPESRFFSGNKRRIELGNISVNGQTEGIAFSADGTGFISSERFSVFGLELPQRLLAFTTQQWTNPLVNTDQQAKATLFDWQIYPNPAQDYLNLQFSQPLLQSVTCGLYSSLGKNDIQFQIPKGTLEYQIAVSEGMKGMMIIQLHFPQGMMTRRLFIQ